MFEKVLQNVAFTVKILHCNFFLRCKKVRIRFNVLLCIKKDLAEFSLGWRKLSENLLQQFIEVLYSRGKFLTCFVEDLCGK